MESGMHVVSDVIREQKMVNETSLVEENDTTDDENEERMFFEPMCEEILDEPVFKFVFEDSPKNVIKVAKVIIPVAAERKRSDEHVITVSPEAAKHSEVGDLSFEAKIKLRKEKAPETFEEKGEPSPEAQAAHRSNEINSILRNRAIVVLERCSFLEPSSSETPTKNHCQPENEKDEENIPLAEVKREQQKTVGEKADESELSFSDGARKVTPVRGARKIKKTVSSAEAKEKDETNGHHGLSAETEEEQHKEVLEPETHALNEFKVSDGIKKCRSKRRRRRKATREAPEQREKRLAAKRLACREWRAMKRCVSSSGFRKVKDETDDEHSISAETKGEKREKVNETVDEEELEVSHEDENCEQRRRRSAREALEPREKWKAMKKSFILSIHNSTTAFDRKLQRRAIVVLERCTLPSSSTVHLLKNVKLEIETDDEISPDVNNCEDYDSHESGTEKKAKTVETRVEASSLRLFLSSEVSTGIAHETLKQEQQLQEGCLSHDVDEEKLARMSACKAKKTRRKIADETPEQRERRLKTDAKCKRKLRANETPEQREKRNKISAKCKKKRHANETPEERERRNKLYSEWRKKRRANETPEARERRLELKRNAARRLKERRRYETYEGAIETPESYSLRDDDLTLDYSSFLAHGSNIMVIVNEEDGECNNYYPPDADGKHSIEVPVAPDETTLDPSERRRLAKNLASRNQRANETPEQRQKRLEARYLARNKRLANETPEQREKRLEADKKRQMTKRRRNRSSRRDELSLTNSNNNNSSSGFFTNNYHSNEELFGTFFSHYSNDFDGEDAGADDDEARSNYCSTSSDTNHEDREEEILSHSSHRFGIFNGDGVGALAAADNVELIII